MSEELKLILYPALVSGGIGLVTIIVNMLLKWVDPATKQQIKKEATEAWKEIAASFEKRLAAVEDDNKNLRGTVEEQQRTIEAQQETIDKQAKTIKAQEGEITDLRGQVQALQIENTTLKSGNGNGKRGGLGRR